MSKLKLISVFTCGLALCFALSSCGGSSNSAASSESASEGIASSSAGAASSPAASTAAQKSTPDPLIIEESGYTITDQGYVMYGFTIKNPNDSFGAQFPTVQITGKTADGKIAFSDSQTLMDIYPGESITYGSQAGNQNVPDTVEFSVTVNSSNWKQTDAKRENLYTIDNVADAGAQYGMGSFTGEITLNSDVEDAAKPAITLILRDDAGNIIYGTTTFQMSDLAVGVPAAFEVNAYGLPESYASFDVHATPWM